MGKCRRRHQDNPRCESRDARSLIGTSLYRLIVVPLGSRSATSVSQRIGIVLACVTSARDQHRAGEDFGIRADEQHRVLDLHGVATATPEADITEGK